MVHPTWHTGTGCFILGTFDMTVAIIKLRSIANKCEISKDTVKVHFNNQPSLINVHMIRIRKNRLFRMTNQTLKYSLYI